MANNKRQSDESLAAAKRVSVRQLLTKLEVAHQAGTLKPVSQSAKPVTFKVADQPSVSEAQVGAHDRNLRTKHTAAELMAEMSDGLPMVEGWDSMAPVGDE